MAAVEGVDVALVCDRMGHQARPRFLPSEKGKEAMEPTVTADGSAKGGPLVLHKAHPYLRSCSLRAQSHSSDDANNIYPSLLSAEIQGA
jgi:hypothetical protein